MAADYDSPWKEALDLYFEAFLALLFPKVWAQIDWARGHEPLCLGRDDLVGGRDDVPAGQRLPGSCRCFLLDRASSDGTLGRRRGRSRALRQIGPEDLRKLGAV